MFLKRLETVGFKSFAERVQIEFVPGITAVVGPNGSGKSNIIDAIRWVLGEQSAKSLRGQKMEDIIFQGSDTRNPLNFAEVSLILNNEDDQLPIDYQEVNVTRRVYRSGESEFFINKQACRLKDIVDLFMDTGLGRESFSIIGQGKIDEILSSKAEERRAVFEEAAGVLKYKQRKQKAQFKLTETEDNLDRVEDIIHEIEKQIKPLKEQSMIAKQYKEMKSELTDKEIALLVTEIDQLHMKWNTLHKEIEEAKLVEMKEKTEIQKREANVTEKRQQIQHFDQEITKLQNELVKVTEQLEQCEGKRNVLIERGKHRQENKQKLLKDKQALQVRIDDTARYMKAEKVKLTEVNETIQQITKEMKQLQNKLDHGVDGIKEEIEDLKSDYIEYLNEQAVLQNEQTSIARQLEQTDKKVKQQSDHDRAYLDEELQLKHSKRELDEKITSRAEQISKLEVTIAQLKEELFINRKTYETMQKKLYAGNEHIAKLTSRKEMLEEMKDSFQGFFYGVKEILQAKKMNLLQHIEGAVVDLIHVPLKYMTAIDTILGAQAQNIVVPNDQVARSAIEWLKRENKGRATFLPIESIDDRSISHSVLRLIEKQRGYIGIASNIVQTSEKYKKVINHLMGNVIITESLQDANEIAKLTSRKFRVVTLDGDVVYPGGSMSGGAKKKTNQSLFTREREIEELKVKITKYTVRANQFVKEVEKQKELIMKLENKILQDEKQLEQLKISFQKTQAKQNEVELKLKTVQDNLTTYHFNLKHYMDEKKELQAAREANHKQLEHINLQISHTEKQIEQLTSKLQTVQNEERYLEKKLHELQVMNAEQEERKRNYLDKINTFETQIYELQSNLSHVVEQIEDIEVAEQEVTTEETIENKINNYKQVRQSIEIEMDEKRKRREENLKSTEDEEREIKAKYKVYENFVRHIQEKEVQANRLDVALETRLSTLQTKYVMTYEKAAQMYERVQNVEEVKNDVKQLKQSIEQLGTVNLGAIEEFKRITERYEFLIEQQQDLIKAKTTLYHAIKEMDEEMTNRFKEMFSKIQSSFTIVFKKLFGGGHAELTLTNPNDLLETGVEIVARPPGKKLKTLGLLSGGEKALTAIALLFAILRARPVPFCILDEVDAALDEANVERFGSYLKTFSKETQFIVISHRKGTMEEADALYGVTMQESGVSRLVSVRLEDTHEFVEAT